MSEGEFGTGHKTEIKRANESHSLAVEGLGIGMSKCNHLQNREDTVKCKSSRTIEHILICSSKLVVDLQTYH